MEPKSPPTTSTSSSAASRQPAATFASPAEAEVVKAISSTSTFRSAANERRQRSSAWPVVQENYLRLAMQVAVVVMASMTGRGRCATAA